MSMSTQNERELPKRNKLSVGDEEEILAMFEHAGVITNRGAIYRSGTPREGFGELRLFTQQDVISMLEEMQHRASSPLLSRIAELEKKLNFFEAVDAATIQKLEETVRQQQSRIDALSKDAERYHKVKKFMRVEDVGEDGPLDALCFYDNELTDSVYIPAHASKLPKSEMIDAAIDTLPSPDAAISAREGE